MLKASIIIFLLSLSSGLMARTGVNSDTTVVAADTLSVTSGKVPLRAGETISVSGSFLRPLQERDSVLIADQVLYGFELEKVKEGTLLVLPEMSEVIGEDVMVLGPWKIDTLKVKRQGKGMPRLLDIRGSMCLTSFEEGIHSLPQISLLRKCLDGATDTLLFEALELDVKTMPVDTATFKPHDIKGQVKYPITLAEVLPWLAGVQLLAMLCAVICCLVMIYKRRNNPQYVRKDPAHIVALRKLDTFRGNRFWAPQKQKDFYSGVTDALKEYIAERYCIGAMEMTTAELFEAIGTMDIPEELLRESRDLFERADFVKFA